MRQMRLQLGISEDMTEKEQDEWLKLKNAKNLNTIKKCAVFATTLAAIGLVAGIILLFVL